MDNYWPLYNVFVSLFSSLYSHLSEQNENEIVCGERLRGRSEQHICICIARLNLYDTNNIL